MISPLLDRMDGLTTIVGYDRWGFNISNVHMRGSVLVMPTFTLLWDVVSAVDIDPRSVAPLFMFDPKPEFLLIGTGTGAMTHVNPALYAFLARKGISMEAMSIVRCRGCEGGRPPTTAPWHASAAACPASHAVPPLPNAPPPPPLNWRAPAARHFHVQFAAGRGAQGGSGAGGAGAHDARRCLPVH
jgi:uncharacterized protein